MRNPNVFICHHVRHEPVREETILVKQCGFRQASNVTMPTEVYNRAIHEAILQGAIPCRTASGNHVLPIVGAAGNITDIKLLNVHVPDVMNQGVLMAYLNGTS